MRSVLILLLAVFCLNCFAQTNNASVKILKISRYGPDGNLWPVHGVQMDTVKKIGTKLGLRYCLSHLPSYISLPDSFVNTKYKSQKVVIPYGEQVNTKFHYTIYSTYDSLSRVTNYGKTQCQVCNFLGYEYNVHYNGAGQLDEINGVPHTFSQMHHCKIYYDTNGNIRQIDYYESDTLHSQLIVM